MGRMYRQKQAILAASSMTAAAAATVGARPDAATAAADLRLIQLTEHRKQLKALQSVEKKIALKAEILPEYADWIEGLLSNSEALPAGVSNDVLTTIMVWSIDVGAYASAYRIAEVVLDKNIPLPSQFDRTPACLIAEEVSHAAMDAIKNGDEFDWPMFKLIMQLVEPSDIPDDPNDMPDEVYAKLFKADALLADRAATVMEEDGGEAADGMAGAYRELLNAGLKSAKRAMELDSKAGVVKLTQRFERQLKNIAPTEGAEGEAKAEAKGGPKPKAKPTAKPQAKGGPKPKAPPAAKK